MSIDYYSLSDINSALVRRSFCLSDVIFLFYVCDDVKHCMNADEILLFLFLLCF